MNNQQDQKANVAPLLQPNALSASKIRSFVFDNKVTLLFVVLSVISFIGANRSLEFLLMELFTRISRNTFTVLALIIPVLTGLGLNFGIVVGAMAAQIATFIVIYRGFTGTPALLLIVVISTPIAILFGWLVGALFNKMKGSETIGGLVLGYFSEGLYQLLFLFVIGTVIKVNNDSPLMIPGGKGVINAIDLESNIKYSLDNIPMLTILRLGCILLILVTFISWISRMVSKTDLKAKRLVTQLGIGLVLFAITFVPLVQRALGTPRLMLYHAMILIMVLLLATRLLGIILAKLDKTGSRTISWKKELGYLLLCVGVFALTLVPSIHKAIIAVQLPVMTYLCIAGLCFFNSLLMRTKLGQNMRTVGQSRTVANAAGINVDRTRIIAMILSTLLACWGQIIMLQNMGTFSVYGAHTNVGLFAIAALLVGGASVDNATSKHAILGVILFHTLFILAPQAGQEFFGNAMIGEYFRVFVAYMVIAISLAMHAWKKRGSSTLPAPRIKQSATPTETI